MNQINDELHHHHHEHHHHNQQQQQQQHLFISSLNTSTSTKIIDTLSDPKSLLLSSPSTSPLTFNKQPTLTTLNDSAATSSSLSQSPSPSSTTPSPEATITTTTSATLSLSVPDLLIPFSDQSFQSGFPLDDVCQQSSLEPVQQPPLEFYPNTHHLHPNLQQPLNQHQSVIQSTFEFNQSKENQFYVLGSISNGIQRITDNLATIPTNQRFWIDQSNNNLTYQQINNFGSIPTDNSPLAFLNPDSLQNCSIINPDTLIVPLKEKRIECSSGPGPITKRRSRRQGITSGPAYLAPAPTSSSSTSSSPPASLLSSVISTTSSSRSSSPYEISKRRGCKNDGINPQCVICNDFASGRHYGVSHAKIQSSQHNYQIYKGFFDIYKCNRVTNSQNEINNNSIDEFGESIGNRCEILVDLNRRRCCKSCRFKKCIDAGMKYEPSTIDTKSSSNEGLDILFNQETIGFQCQLYRSYENNIGSLMGQYRNFLGMIEPIKDFAAQPTIGTRKFLLIIAEYLTLMADEMLRKFLSYIEEFRAIPIDEQNVMINDAKHWLVCLTLASILPSIKQQIEFDKIIFAHQKFHDDLQRLQKLLVVIGDTMQTPNHTKNPAEITPIKFSLNPSVTNLLPPTMLNQIESNRIIAEKITINAISLDLINQICYESYCQCRVFDPEENFFEIENVKRLEILLNKGTANQQTNENIMDSFPRASHSSSICAEDERKQLLEMKKRFRFVPLLLAFVLIRSGPKSSSSNSETNRLREMILLCLQSEHSLFEKIITENGSSTSSPSENELRRIFQIQSPSTPSSSSSSSSSASLESQSSSSSMCNLIDDGSISDQFVLSKLYNYFQDTTVLMASLVAILRLRYSIGF
ncbi:hypothetical protein SSS_03257 [Sarcoptes scabiei]|uniref:Nuclear receptor domain-containing protein n=1 Tax=Sarcoptes scabiei TaxID=52283 RepID=A0A834QYL9_SARSC|nr:hypothetical protein SSS_03257 [Sarcoptes scabiei]